MDYAQVDQFWNDVTDILERCGPNLAGDATAYAVRAALRECADKLQRIREATEATGE